MELGLCLRHFLLGAFELGDVRDHRHRTARRRATAIDLMDTAVGRAVLEGLIRGVTQTLHPLGDKRLDVTLTVVPVLGQIAK